MSPDYELFSYHLHSLIFETNHYCCKGCGPFSICWKHPVRLGITLQHTDSDTAAVGDLMGVRLGRFTGSAYVEIPDEVFLSSARAMCSPSGAIFQDSSPIHTSSVQRAWFRRHPEISLCHTYPNCQILLRECLGSHGQRLPLRPYSQSPYRRYPSNYSVGGIALCRRTPVTVDGSGICDAEMPAFAKLVGVTRKIKSINVKTFYFPLQYVWIIKHWHYHRIHLGFIICEQGYQ